MIIQQNNGDCDQSQSGVESFWKKTATYGRTFQTVDTQMHSLGGITAANGCIANGRPSHCSITSSDNFQPIFFEAYPMFWADDRCPPWMLMEAACDTNCEGTLHGSIKKKTRHSTLEKEGEQHIANKHFSSPSTCTWWKREQLTILQIDKW